MVRDPRIKPKQADNADVTPAPPPASILLSGDDEPMDVDEALPPPSSFATPAPTSYSADTSSYMHQQQKNHLLITPIITPSPYPQHNSGPTSTRFKNALNRVTLQPTRDVEAWQALLTEAQSCYKTLQESASAIMSPHEASQRQLQLDWIESCYGYLLQNFPYASHHYVRIAQMLYAQSARPGEDDEEDLALAMSDEQTWTRRYGNSTAEQQHRHLPTHSSQRAVQCEQKLFHLLQQTLGFDLEGKVVPAAAIKDGAEGDADDGDANILGGICVWTVELWLVYIFTAARQAQRRAQASIAADDVDARHMAVRQATQKAFDLAVQHAGFAHNNHVLWKHYLAFVRSWTLLLDQNQGGTFHAVAQQQMVQLRSVYQRAVCLPMTGLDQLWNEYEAFERGQSEALAQALLQDFAPKYQHARTVYLERNRVYGGAADLQIDRLATDPVVESEDDYAVKMDDEYKLLRIWKVRTSYQRTNPERLSPSDSAQRIRQSYKEMVCVFTRHPECWHQWSMWELESKSLERAIAVLQLAQILIPDSALLAYAEAQIVELSGRDASGCIAVMERLLTRSPSTLGFVICQQLVRRYKGAEEARALFARARRVLASDAVRSTSGKDDQPVAVEKAAQEGETGDGGPANDEAEKRNWMVTNRLDPSIGSEGIAKSEQPASRTKGADIESSSSQGVLTWHLYAAHAAIEHRLNGLREVAARIYELGLRKHGKFLTKAPYVSRYGQLLLELGDTVNLRALLRRAVAACEEQGKGGSLAALWDISLYFESLLDSDESSAARLDDIERKRRAAVLGPDIEDVATGGLLSSSDVPLIGAQKTSISEQLVRTEGYDASSKIMSGMSRALEFLNVSGYWGSDGSASLFSRNKMKHDKESEISGGISDALYEKRAQYQVLASSGMGLDAPTGEAGATAKVLSARERLQQQAGGIGAGQSTAMMLVIQQSPDWLRSLLMMLPASKLRLPIVPKPPPHLTEMALATLRLNSLPAERPAETLSKKRARDDADGDDIDDEDGNRKGGGYGTAFRSRQRSRLAPENGLID